MKVMTWVEYHKQSEQFAGEAEAAEYKGEADRARELYRRAAELEEKALSVLDRQKMKTLGITVVSVAALWFKAGQLQQACRIAEEWLASETLPAFATTQLVGLVHKIWLKPWSNTSIHSGKTITTPVDDTSRSLATSINTKHYQVHIFWDSGLQVFLAQAPELPGCVADGSTRQEAVANLEVAIEEWVETAKELNCQIPQPENHHALA
jgi:predicted RNase H-like HicB family nuclease